jgi:hypothetical protein
MTLSPLDAVLKDGVCRVQEFMTSETFEFVVNGKVLRNSLTEAVFLSPAIYESLRADPTSRQFTISNFQFPMMQLTSLASNYFFLSSDQQALSVFRRLAVVLLCCLTLETGELMINADSTSSSHDISSGGGVVMLSSASLDYCGSQFYCY